MTRWSIDGLSAIRGRFRLAPIDLGVGDGEVVAVLGPSGAGKTTLLRTLTGLLPSDAGRIVCDGSQIDGLPPERRGIGYVPQGLALFPDRSVFRNVAYPRELRGDDRSGNSVRELLERFGLTSLRDRSPATLSSGEQQRVAIARALASRPRLLLWDEPLTAIDLLARDDLIEALREVQRRDGLPTIVVTHDPTIAFSLADRFLLLDEGSVRFSGTPVEMLRTPPDPFAARFAGFENVYTPTQIAGAADGPFGEHLRARSGFAGVGLRTVTATGSGASSAWTARALRVAATPTGWRCEAQVDGLPIRLTLPSGEGVRTGDPVGFSIDVSDIVALGSGGSGP